MNIGVHRLTPSPALPPTSAAVTPAQPPAAVRPTAAPPLPLDLKAQVLKSQTQTAELRTLTASQLPEAVMAQAQTQGAEQINAVANRPGVLAWLKSSSLGRYFEKVFAQPVIPADAHGSLQLPEGVLPERVQDPGIKGKFAHDARIYKTDPRQLKGEAAADDYLDVYKGDHCTYSRTDDPHLLKVEKYHRDENDNLVFDFKGFVYTRDVTSHFQARRHKMLDADALLFPHPPSVHDVKQGAIGDCYFMAGLASIVAQKPDAVKNMIRDNGDGTVTVKLFDVRETDGQKSFHPKYLSFDKSVLHTDFAIREHASKEAPWVALLEKAYATHTGSYARMGEGGFASDVYEALLGQPALKQEIQSQPLKTALSQVFTLPDTAAQEKDPDMRHLAMYLEGMAPRAKEIVAQAEAGTLKRDELHSLITARPPVLLGAPSTLNAIRSALRAEKLENSALITSLIMAFRKVPPLNTPQEIEDELKRVHPPLTEAVQKTILRVTTPAPLSAKQQEQLQEQLAPHFSGPRGSGIYADSQVALYEQIRSGLAAGKPMGTGSRHTLANEDNEAGGVGTAGEEVVHGLVGGHDFAITGVMELRPGERGYPGADDGPPLRFVRLRNPWGDMSESLSRILNATGVLAYGAREYRFNRETGKLEAHATHGAEYLCELSDYTRNFEHIYST